MLLEMFNCTQKSSIIQKKEGSIDSILTNYIELDEKAPDRLCVDLALVSSLVMFLHVFDLQCPLVPHPVVD